MFTLIKNYYSLFEGFLFFYFKKNFLFYFLRNFLYSIKKLSDKIFIIKLIERLLNYI